MLTAKQFAERAKVSYPTVIKWLREEMIPGAKKVEDKVFGDYWSIPATSIKSVFKRKPGPRPGSKHSKKRMTKKAGTIEISGREGETVEQSLSTAEKNGKASKRANGKASKKKGSGK